MARRQLTFIWVLLWFALSLNVLTWFSVRHEQSRWTNVPTAPSANAALGMGLGDAQLSYRIISLMVQNMGDFGGRRSLLLEYNYETLSNWFYLSDKLDAKSDFVSYLAAFYFSAVANPAKLPPLINYLYAVGNNPNGEKFRWLAQAVYLARYKMEDYDLAYKMAQDLANMNRPDLPIWARSMPAYVKSAAGEKEAAIAILLELLSTSSDKLHPNEVNATVAKICEDLLDAEEAKRHPLCQKTPEEIIAP